MSFEATKNLSDARLLVKAVEQNLKSISGYSSPAFDVIGGGKGVSPKDRTADMLLRKERIVKKYTAVTDACLCLEEAAQAELGSVDNLELRALIQFRYLDGMSWPEIARHMGGNVTPDAVKKRFERGIKAYEEQGIEVPYTPKARRALGWLVDAKGCAGTAEADKAEACREASV